MADPAALVLAFALEDLRRSFGAAAPAGADPRHDTSPFRAFRHALLRVLARRASSAGTVSFWWEGTFNGYALAVSIEPHDAVGDVVSDVEAICPVESMRVATPREARGRLKRSRT